MGESLGCQLGAIWEQEPDNGRLICVDTWCAPDFGGDEFARVTREYTFAPGTGLPGRVWASGQPAWIVDVADDPNFPRSAAATAAGLTSAFCFPLRSANGVLGVIEIYAEEPRIPDRELLDTMAALGDQLGQFVVRRRAERDVRESEARKRAILASALDCVITIDHAGRVLEFNEAAEVTFGYTAEHAVGKEMAVLIVPPALR